MPNMLLVSFLWLPKLLITIVSGSVAVQRVFSALEFVKTTRRNRLEGEHLELCTDEGAELIQFAKL